VRIVRLVAEEKRKLSGFSGATIAEELVRAHLLTMNA